VVESNRPLNRLRHWPYIITLETSAVYLYAPWTSHSHECEAGDQNRGPLIWASGSRRDVYPRTSQEETFLFEGSDFDCPSATVLPRLSLSEQRFKLKLVSAGISAFIRYIENARSMLRLRGLVAYCVSLGAFPPLELPHRTFGLDFWK